MYFKHFEFIIILKKFCFYSVLKAEDFKVTCIFHVQKRDHIHEDEVGAQVWKWEGKEAFKG
jgi:hypothetical protein